MKMLEFFEIAGMGVVETLLVSMPESLGLLAFGIGLVALAVFVRWFMARGEAEKRDKEVPE